MSARTLRALWRNRHRDRRAFRRDPGNRARFISMFREPRGHHARAAADESATASSARYLPAFGRIVGQMQHDLFHVYTVDEHILMVIRNLRRFTEPQHAHEYPLCSPADRATSSARKCSTSPALFHDIAKGRGGDHFDARRASTRAASAAQHGLPREDVELVAWLVEHHLVDVRRRRRSRTSPIPTSIADVRARGSATSARLIALYLLTVADIRGTSPQVWNAWKAQAPRGPLPRDARAARGRRRRRTLPTACSGAAVGGAAAAATLRRAGRRRGSALWKQLDTLYFQRHTADEIAWHARQLLLARRQHGAGGAGAAVARRGAGLQVLVYLPDQKELFARICGFFGRSGLSILEAKVHTTRNGYALDTFAVHDPANPPASYRDAHPARRIRARRSVLTEQRRSKPPVTGRARGSCSTFR